MPITWNTPKASISIATTVEPTGVPPRMEISIPVNAQNTDSAAEHMVTALKLLNTRMADSAGKITNADISSDPTRFIASTMMTATTTAISKL